MLWPFLLENDDGLSLAVQYAGRGHNRGNFGVTLPNSVSQSLGSLLRKLNLAQQQQPFISNTKMLDYKKYTNI